MPDEKRPIVIYHAACQDGGAAALAAYLKFGDDAVYIPAHYGDPPPADALVRDRSVFLLDFCFDRPQIERMMALCDLRVLDHHRTHAEAFAGFDGPLHFDMERSGATLAYRHFFPDREVPELFRYVEAWSDDYRERLAREGYALMKLQDQLIESMVERAERVVLDGVEALATNAAVLFSEVAEALWMKLPPMGIAYYWDGQRGAYHVSLRSNDGFKVSEVALRHGGGGHDRAAAFQARELPWRR